MLDEDARWKETAYLKNIAPCKHTRADDGSCALAGRNLYNVNYI